MRHGARPRESWARRRGRAALLPFSPTPVCPPCPSALPSALAPAGAAAARRRALWPQRSSARFRRARLPRVWCQALIPARKSRQREGGRARPLSAPPARERRRSPPPAHPGRGWGVGTGAGRWHAGARARARGGDRASRPGGGGRRGAGAAAGGGRSPAAQCQPPPRRECGLGAQAARADAEIGARGAGGGSCAVEPCWQRSRQRGSDTSDEGYLRADFLRSQSGALQEDVLAPSEGAVQGEWNERQSRHPAAEEWEAATAAAREAAMRERRPPGVAKGGSGASPSSRAAGRLPWQRVRGGFNTVWRSGAPCAWAIVGVTWAAMRYGILPRWAITDVRAVAGA